MTAFYSSEISNRPEASGKVALCGGMCVSTIINYNAYSSSSVKLNPVTNQFVTHA
jgi:hypothetical protein